MSSRKRHSFIPLKKIPKGGVFAITSPATMPDSGKLEKGIRYLKSFGYRVKVGESCYTSDYYVAGDDASRASEFMNFVEDPSIDGIICSRGGYGSMRLLPLLDYEKIREMRKPLIGFSDITALQWGIYARCGLPSISGGMVATDMANRPVNEEFERTFWHFIQSGSFSYPLAYSGEKPASIHGICLPGTVSIISKLLGSPFAPNIENSILVLEDVDEPTHKIEGYLMHLRLAGFFDRSRAMLMGQFLKAEQESYPSIPSLPKVFDTIFKGINGPVVKDVSYGHIPEKIPFPVGAPILLSLGAKSSIKSTESIFEH